jgi:hypothetical protein
MTANWIEMKDEMHVDDLIVLKIVGTAVRTNSIVVKTAGTAGKMYGIAARTDETAVRISVTAGKISGIAGMIKERPIASTICRNVCPIVIIQKKKLGLKDR